MLSKLFYKSFLIILLSIFFQNLFALSFYKYKGFQGILFLDNEEKIEIEVLSLRHLQVSSNCPKNIKNFFETLWVASNGRKAIIHLLKSKSKIHINITDSIGAFIYKGNVDFMYAITGPIAVNGKKKTIIEYDGKKTWEAMSIFLCKGSFNFSHHDTSLFNSNKIVIIDYFNGNRLSGISRDSAILKLKNIYFHNDSIKRKLIAEKSNFSELEKTVNPNNEACLYQTCREFYYLSGIHEINHTTTRNIFLSRKLLDTETPAFKAERKAKRKLKKVLRCKYLDYQECD